MSRLKREATARVEAAMGRSRKAPSSGPRDRFVIAGWIVLGVGSMIAFGMFVIVMQWRSSIDKRLERWRITYHLDDAQIASIRMAEFEFHGSGNPFTTPSQHDDKAVEQHHRQLASLMGEQEGRNFLKSRPEGRSHQ